MDPYAHNILHWVHIMAYVSQSSMWSLMDLVIMEVEPFYAWGKEFCVRGSLISNQAYDSLNFERALPPAVSPGLTTKTLGRYNLL